MKPSRHWRLVPPAMAQFGMGKNHGMAWQFSRGTTIRSKPGGASPGDAEDSHSRYIEATVNGVLIGCLYLPNGNPQPGPKFDYKLAWFERLIRHAGSLCDS